MARLTEYTLDDFLQREFPSGEVLVDGMIYKGETTMLFAPPKHAKTIFAQQLALCLALGVPFLGRDVPKPRRVLYVALEGTEEELQKIQRRILAHLGGRAARAELVLAKGAYLPLDEDRAWDEFEQKVERYGPDLLILDPLYRLVRGSLKDDEVTALITARLNLLTEHHGHATVLLHHAHRARRSSWDGEVINEGAEGYFGSFVLQAWPSNMYRLDFKRGAHEAILSLPVERTPRFGPDIKLKLIDTEQELGFVPEGLAIPSMAETLLSQWERVEGLSLGEMQEVLGLTNAKKELGNAVRKLGELGLVRIEGGGQGKAIRAYKTGGS